jgi:hypothetical protein
MASIGKVAAWAACGLLAMAAPSVRGAVIYGNTSDSALAYCPANTSMIIYDDVLLPSSNSVLNITRLTVGIFKPATAQPFTMDIYAIAVDVDGYPIATPTPLTATPITVEASPDEGVQLISVGDGVSTLITMPLNVGIFYSSELAGFAVGVRLNTTSNSIGWNLASPTELNADTYGKFNLANPSSASNGFLYNLGGVAPATFHLSVEGSSVPEPASCAPLALSSAPVGRRPRG